MNNQEAKLEKIKTRSLKSAKILTIISRVVIILGIFVAVVGIGTLILNAPLEKAINSHPEAIKSLDTDFNFNFGFLGGHVNFSNDSESMNAFEKMSDFTGIGKYSLLIAIACISGAIVLFVSALIMHLLKKVFIHFSQSETPFDSSFLKYLKKIFIILTILIFLMSDGILAVFMGLFFWCIYSMFDYGCELQKENDELL